MPLMPLNPRQIYWKQLLLVSENRAQAVDTTVRFFSLVEAATVTY